MAPPVNTPRLGQAQSELDFGIIEEKIESKFDLGLQDDVTTTHSTGTLIVFAPNASSSQQQNTNVSDDIDETTTTTTTSTDITTQLPSKLNSRSGHLKPYQKALYSRNTLTNTSSAASDRSDGSNPTTTTKPRLELKGNYSVEYTINPYNNMTQLDILDEEEIMILPPITPDINDNKTSSPAYKPSLPPLNPIAIDTSLPNTNYPSTPKKYRHRKQNTDSNAVTPLFRDENEVVRYAPNNPPNLRLAETEEDLLDNAATFGRMQNLRATMREDHIRALKDELLADINEDLKNDNNEENGVNEQKRESLKEKIKRKTSHEKQVEAIQLTKEELEREKKLLQLKKKTNKRIAFGADMALEILQESIQKEEEKRRAAQHEFYVQQLYSVTNKSQKASTMHLMKSPITTPKASPKASPPGTPIKLSLNNDDMLGVQHQNSANTNYSDDGEFADITIKKNPFQFNDDEAKTTDAIDIQMTRMTSRNVLNSPVANGGNGLHLRSKSDNQMIKDIATQITMHAKQINKNPANKTKKRKRPKTSSRDYRYHIKATHSLDHSGEHDGILKIDVPISMMQNKPQLSLMSVSENRNDRKQNNMKNKGMTFKSRKRNNFLTPNDRALSNDERDVYDIYDGLRGIQKSPSPPPIYAKHNNSFDDELKTHSIFQTFRSWISPISISRDRQNSKHDSDRAADINAFLKMAGFTAHSANVDAFVDIMDPISENNPDADLDGNINIHPTTFKMTHDDFNNDHVIDIQYNYHNHDDNNNHEDDDKNNQDRDDEKEDNKKYKKRNSTPIGHGVFSIDPKKAGIDMRYFREDNYENSDMDHDKNMGHTIMNLGPINDTPNSDTNNDNEQSTQL